MQDFPLDLSESFFFRVLSAAGGLLKWPPFREAVLKMLENNIDSPHLLSFLVDCYEEQLEKEANEDSLKKAMEVYCDFLFKVYLDLC